MVFIAEIGLNHNGNFNLYTLNKSSKKMLYGSPDTIKIGLALID